MGNESLNGILRPTMTEHGWHTQNETKSGWVSTCECGWTVINFDTSYAAWEAWEDHAALMARRGLGDEIPEPQMAGHNWHDETRLKNFGWISRCECGWNFSGYQSREAAEQGWQSHLRQSAFGHWGQGRGPPMKRDPRTGRGNPRPVQEIHHLNEALRDNQSNAPYHNRYQAISTATTQAENSPNELQQAVMKLIEDSWPVNNDPKYLRIRRNDLAKLAQIVGRNSS